jgi:hypothetical protein
MAILTQGWAQDKDAITRFFTTYAEDENFTVVTVTKRMFALFADIDAEDPKQKEAMEAISKIDGLRILALEEDSLRAPQLYKEAKKVIPINEYDELMSIRREGMDFRFMIKEEDSKIAELLMIGGSTSDFFVMSLIGDIDLNQISKLSGAMNIDGFENLEMLEDRDNH